MKKILLILVIIFVFFSSAFIIDADVTVDTNWNFESGNETYMVNDTTRTFSKIIVNDTYIVFNNTGFNVTSANPITIYIDYINSSIINASNNDLVLEFCADTSGGSVTFNIDGLRNNYYYSVRRNGTLITNTASNATGHFSFTNNVWSKKSFQIYQQNIVTNNSPVISIVYPGNNSRHIETTPICYIVVSDPEGDSMNISFSEYFNNTWTLQQNNNSVGNGTYYWTYNNATRDGTRYYWNVSVFDGNNYNNNTYNFRTEETLPDAGQSFSDDEPPKKDEETLALMHPGFIFLVILAIIATIFIITFLAVKNK